MAAAGRRGPAAGGAPGGAGCPGGAGRAVTGAGAARAAGSQPRVPGVGPTAFPSAHTLAGPVEVFVKEHKNAFYSVLKSHPFEVSTSGLTKFMM